MEKILGFYHICLVNHWRDIVSEQIKLILKTNLYQKTHKIFIGCLGSEKEKKYLEKMLPSKCQIIFHSQDVKLAEVPILQYLQDISRKDNFLAWYIHTKGVYSEYNWNPQLHNIHILKWRKIMEYFIIEKHDDCIKVIDSCDACGIDVRLLDVGFLDEYLPGRYWVFIGNFWWSKSNHVKKLPNLTEFWIKSNKSRFAAEVFIGLTTIPKFYSFYNKETDVNLQDDYRDFSWSPIIVPSKNILRGRIKLK